MMEVYSYTLPELWELTLPEIATHLEKLTPTVSEPEWFVQAWRDAKDDLERLTLLRKLLGD